MGDATTRQLIHNLLRKHKKRKSMLPLGFLDLPTQNGQDAFDALLSSEPVANAAADKDGSTDEDQPCSSSAAQDPATENATLNAEGAGCTGGGEPVANAPDESQVPRGRAKGRTGAFRAVPEFPKSEEGFSLSADRSSVACTQVRQLCADACPGTCHSTKTRV
eukprot:1839335-Rhodomonas_salina.2